MCSFFVFLTLILSYLILSCLILSYLILSYLILSYLVFSSSLFFHSNHSHPLTRILSSSTYLLPSFSLSLSLSPRNIILSPPKYNSFTSKIQNTIFSCPGVVDALVVVTRYFGGTKLGVGGLSRANGLAAQSE